MKQFSILLFTAIAFIANSQNSPLLQAQKCIGGTGNDAAYSIQQTKDGGYITAGSSYSNDGNVNGHHGTSLYTDYWIVKLNVKGKIQWQKSLGGASNDVAKSLQQTKDGGYIIAGYSSSNDGDVTANYGGYDYWIVKLDPSGNMQWQKNFGGSKEDKAYSIQQTNDGGYIVAGYSYSFDNDVTGHHQNFDNPDYWIVKLNAAGNLQWQKSLGGTAYDVAWSICQTTDGGYIVAGGAASDNGDIISHHGSNEYTDYWIVKLNAIGSMQWQKCYGGSYLDMGRSIQQTKDGGYIVAGSTESFDGDVIGHHTFNWTLDYWILKLDVTGNIQWQKSLGGYDFDDVSEIRQTKDGGYIATGSTESYDGDVTGNHGIIDNWTVKLDVWGNMQWQKCLGGSNSDYSTSIQQTIDGGYIVAGIAQSNDGDVSGNNGGADYWLVKLSASGGFAERQPILTAFNRNNHQLTISPNPVQSILHIRGLSSNINYQLRIMNESGTVLFQTSIKNISSYDIDVSKLASGIYYLQAGEERVKFVKE